MAPSNGARKGPPGAENSSARGFTKLGLVDPAFYDKVFADADKRPVKLKVKKTLIKQSNPGTWNDENVVTQSGKDKEEAATPTTPLINRIDDKIASAFPSGRPFEDVADIVQCKHCKKPVLKNGASDHIKSCLRKKQEKQQKKKEAKEAKDAALRKERNGGVSPAPSEDLAEAKGARKTATIDGEVAKKSGKKRKAEDDGKGNSAKKKKKEDVKAKAPKPKGPVDVERQCGVPLANGGLCARSLTCKSHSMGAKRAVPGRSAPYDLLLAQYQKKNQAKQQRAAIDANAPLADDFEPGNVDSDEEREAVMSALSRSLRTNPLTGTQYAGTPLLNTPIVSITEKYKYHRMKDMLRNALSGANGRDLFATPASHAMSAGLMSANMDVNIGLGLGADAFDMTRRPSMAPSRQAMPGSRKQSVSTQGGL